METYYNLFWLLILSWQYDIKIGKTYCVIKKTDTRKTELETIFTAACADSNHTQLLLIGILCPLHIRINELQDNNHGAGSGGIDLIGTGNSLLNKGDRYFIL